MPIDNSQSLTVLVTGANGQLGRRLLPRLVAAGYKVRAHYRNPERAAKYCPAGIDSCCGDLLETGWLDNAVTGCRIVIHGAARVSLSLGRHEEHRLVNVEGTRAVVEACRRNGVRQLIFVSSVAAVGASKNGRPIDETAPFNLAGFDIPYAETKHQAENLALAANSPGLEVIAVNPSIMISAPDRPVTARDLRKIPRFVPAYFEFGFNVVETWDVVDGIIGAMERGRPGERYLLTGENLTPERAFHLAGQFLGIKKPWLKLPVSFLYPVAALVELHAKIRGKRPKFHRGLARLARLKFFYTNEKARRELGFDPRPLEKTIDDILSGIERYKTKGG